MNKEIEAFLLKDIGGSTLPLPFQKIYTVNIPPIEVEENVLFYNEKFKFVTSIASKSPKPISKLFS